MAVTERRSRKPIPPLTSAKLDELALFYVGRFATSRSKLIAYLNRKLRERGWEGDQPADLDSLADRLVRLGYIDDRAFAVAKARSLTARGYGERRVRQALVVAGIGEDDRADAADHAEAVAIEAALRFAKRRSIGPFSTGSPTPERREKAIAAMVRAGHRFPLARAIAEMAPGDDPDVETLQNLY
jgi:regulatory protein